ncbi:MAG: DUF4290 domain-containing protein [Bacteroidales bacterium]|nr:DUF4290 domain-containing protein [Bacteroidales bacterium]MBR5781669.1 DUF4290 domain-containing protein [Bacteroidales bacterium]
MDKEGLKYNTEREKLIISEYGRNIQIMIKHLLEIEDREKRTEAAHFIVSVMAQMNPQVKESNDYIHKLWDHLYIISEHKLDVDGPYNPPQQEGFVAKPEHVGYQKRDIKHGHYGFYVKELLKKIEEIEEGPKREALLLSMANQMKRDYLNWNRETVNDLLILDDLYKLSGEKFTMPIETKLTSTNEILNKVTVVQQPQQNVKKKKVKKQVVKKTPNPNRPKKNS